MTDPAPEATSSAARAAGAATRRRSRRSRWLRRLLVIVALAALTLPWVIVRDGRLSIPTASDALSLNAFEGASSQALPIDGYAVPSHPFMAGAGRNSMHNDAWASDAYVGPGPKGRNPVVSTAWYGILECATLAFDKAGRLIGLCGDAGGPSLHVIDPVSLRLLASHDLPARVPRPGVGRLEDLCGGAYFFLDQADRAVVLTTDQRVVEVTTSDADGRPALTQTKEWSLAAGVPKGDCPIALMPDWSGRVWFVTRGGAVGTLDRETGTVANLVLPGEGIANSLAADERGGVLVVTDHALYRMTAAADGTPTIDWRTVYDRGSRRKPGQLSQGSGTTPTILSGGLVAITDNADPQMQVLILDLVTGEKRCAAKVLAPGASATENSLVGLGEAVVVENNYGYTSPASTLLTRSTTPGLARVEAKDCTVSWTAQVTGSTSVAKASLATGLVYLYEKRGFSWWLTAVDARTGALAFRVRTGTGVALNNHYAAVTLGPDGTAYIATMTGMVRVADRP